MLRLLGRVCEQGWDENPAVREPRVYEFDEDGIAHAPESGGGEWTELSWSQVREVTRLGGDVALTLRPTRHTGDRPRQ